MENKNEWESMPVWKTRPAIIDLIQTVLMREGRCKRERKRY